MLLDRVWSSDALPTTNIVDAYIRRLRVKLSLPGLPDPIVTIRGVGYRLRT
jgi:two-component system response regulator MprA